MEPATRCVVVLSSLLLLGPGSAMAEARSEAPVETVFVDRGVASLARAAAHGDAAEVARLVDIGVDPNARGEDGLTPLHWALLHQSRAGFDALLAAGADPLLTTDGGGSVVHYAVMAQDPQYLQALLAHGTTPDPVDPRSGRTPLFDAVGGARPEHLRLLMAAGADPDHVAELGDTPLHVAATRKDYDAILMLLEAGARPEAINAQQLSFQGYLRIGPPDALLGDAARAKRDAVRDWLRAHGIEVTF